MLRDTTLAHLPTAEAAAAALTATPPPRRRRLWQLPAQAHELLLAMSFTPDLLRREAARTLGQIHHGQCVLKGRDVDVLYSVMQDMVTRNPLSETMHKRLDERHALALRRMAKLRDADALQAAWTQALVGDDMPAMLWALLTHPLGAALESVALCEARAWVFAHARRSMALVQTQQQVESRAAGARLEADQLRGRLLVHQQRSAQALSTAQVEITRLTGELDRLQRTSPCKLPPADPTRRNDPRVDAPQPQAEGRLVVPPAAPAAPKTRPPTQPTTLPTVVPAVQPKPASAPIVVQGRRVLCVGGIQHAVALYRERIEKLGGHFEHHDGGVEDSVHALQGRLRRADLVICQAACINHEAYHRVKSHCERTGTPCLYLDRPSLSRLDRALMPATAERQAPSGSGSGSGYDPAQLPSHC